MKKVLTLIIAFSLCLVPLFADGETEEMTEYSAGGIPYFVWSSWVRLEDSFVVAYYKHYDEKDVRSIFEGSLQVSVEVLSKESIPADDQMIDMLKNRVAMEEEGTTAKYEKEILNIHSRPGICYKGLQPALGMNVATYMTYTDSGLVKILLLMKDAEADALRDMLLYQVLGMTEE